jgi:phosphoribosylformylglycinamidine synthase
LPNIEQLKKNYNFVSQNIEDKQIISAYAIDFGGIVAAICKMAFGNEIGVKITNYGVQIKESDLFDLSYGSILVESSVKFDFENAIFLGKTITNYEFQIPNYDTNYDLIIDFKELYKANTEKFTEVYKDK